MSELEHDGLRTHLLADAGVAALIADTATRIRIYPLRLPQKPTLPALVYTRISGAPEHTSDGPDDLVEARVQLDSWASSHKDARALARAVRDACNGFTGHMGTVRIEHSRLTGARDLWSESVAHWGVTQDWIVWFRES